MKVQRRGEMVIYDLETNRCQKLGCLGVGFHTWKDYSVRGKYAYGEE